MGIEMRDFRNYVQYKRALHHLTYTQMIQPIPKSNDFFNSPFSNFHSVSNSNVSKGCVNPL